MTNFVVTGGGGHAKVIVSILNDRNAELPHAESELNFSTASRDTLIVELIIPPSPCCRAAGCSIPA